MFRIMVDVTTITERNMFAIDAREFRMDRLLSDGKAPAEMVLQYFLAQI